MTNRPRLHPVAVCAWAALALSPWVGIARSLVRFSAGTLPDQYLAHSSAINAGLFLVFTTVCLGAVAMLHLRGRVALLAALLSNFVLYWGFNTAIGFGAMRAFARGETETVVRELSLWVPGLIGFGAAAALLLAAAPLVRVLRRGAVVLALGVLGVAGLRVYSFANDPSAVDPIAVEASARSKPPVFLVLVDTLRADHLGVYGYPKPTSPNIDALAAESTVFERAFAPAPWTRPSCAALLTSRYPREIGLDGMFKPLPKAVPILPQYLRSEGYRTAGIVSSVHLSAQFGFDKGWDVLDIGTTYLTWTGTKTAFSRLGLVPWGDTYPRYDARELTDRAIAWLARQRRSAADEPVFMYLHYSDPHAPYAPPAGRDRWREFARPEVREAIAEPPFSPLWTGRDLSPLEVEAMVARYDAEIAYLDEELGRFLAHLRDRGLYDDALIIVTADHGEEFGEHGGWSHAHSLFNELIHVPMIVKYPAAWTPPRDRRVAAISNLVDVVPTIRDVLGAHWPETAFRGRSLAAGHGAAADHAVYARADEPSLRAVLRGGDKLIQTLDANRVVDERYYSLVDDFAEQRDGALPEGLDPARLAELRLALSEIERAPGETSEAISLDRATLQELQALGYVE